MSGSGSGTGDLRQQQGAFQMVAQGGIDRGLRMSNPNRHQLVNFVVIPNIDWNDFILCNDEFKRNPVLQVDRDAV